MMINLKQDVTVIYCGHICLRLNLIQADFEHNKMPVDFELMASLKAWRLLNPVLFIFAVRRFYLIYRLQLTDPFQ